MILAVDSVALGVAAFAVVLRLILVVVVEFSTLVANLFDRVVVAQFAVEMFIVEDTASFFDINFVLVSR